MRSVSPLVLTLAIGIGLVMDVRAASGANSSLCIDGLSFLFSEELESGGPIPTVCVPVQISGGRDQWSIEIQSADFSLPSVTLPTGAVVKWSLVESAIGAIVATSSTSASVEISGEFLAQNQTSMLSARHQLAFSTGESTAVGISSATSREGIPLDRDSGYLNLVAAAKDPPGAEQAIPFFVVISGTLTELPEGLGSAGASN